MTNYYQDLIDNIQKLLNDGQYNQAKQLVEDELKMPYTPKATLEQLENFNKIIQTNLVSEKKTTIKSEEEIYQDLLSQSEKAMSALKTLSCSNVRNYLDVLQKLLLGQEINHLLKCLIFEILIEQHVEEPIEFNKDGTIIEITPCNCQKILQQDCFIEITKEIEKVTFKNPSFTQQCVMVLSNVLYDLFPTTISKNEYCKYAYSIIRYVYNAYDDLKGWQELSNRLNINENSLIEFHF